MGLTANRRWIYTADVKGRFQKLHRRVGILQNVVLFAIPWILIKGHPAILLDLGGRRLHALGTTFTPHDTELLVVLGLMGGISLFFVSALVGRLWCGYLCPQTVFLEEFIRPIEQFFEGPRGKRLKQDKTFPGPPDLIARKLGKLTAFLGVALVLSLTIISYFTPARDLWTGGGPGWAYVGVGISTAVLMTDFVWFREQFCNYLCPYARFQGALTDADSLVVQYDAERGDPRTKRSQQVKLGLNPGSCIDCNKCVTVCPQGIDIRDGFQLECIQCARCVDACEGVMGKLGEKPLVQFTTLEKRPDGKVRWVRPRTVIYGTLLVGLAITFVVLLAGRSAIDASVNRLPGALYTMGEDGSTRNTFMLRVTNTSVEEETYTVSVDGLDNVKLTLPPLTVGAEETVTVPMVVEIPAGQTVARTVPIDVIVETEGDRVSLGATFKTGSDQAKGD